MAAIRPSETYCTTRSNQTGHIRTMEVRIILADIPTESDIKNASHRVVATIRHMHALFKFLCRSFLLFGTCSRLRLFGKVWRRCEFCARTMKFGRTDSTKMKAFDLTRRLLGELLAKIKPNDDHHVLAVYSSVSSSCLRMGLIRKHHRPPPPTHAHIVHQLQFIHHYHIHQSELLLVGWVRRTKTWTLNGPVCCWEIFTARTPHHLTYNHF